jgi:hydrogenase-1 operon protein HyaF
VARVSGLDHIGVQVVTALDNGARSYVPALLREIETLLAELVASGRSSRIDLRSLPLLPGDDARLAALLGDGEVDAALQVTGDTRVRETGVSGVWWVTHANADGEIVAEFIEVTLVPEILKAHPQDVRAGLTRLRARLAELMQEGETDGG